MNLPSNNKLLLFVKIANMFGLSGYKTLTLQVRPNGKCHIIKETPDDEFHSLSRWSPDAWKFVGITIRRKSDFNEEMSISIMKPQSETESETETWSVKIEKQPSGRYGEGMAKIINIISEDGKDEYYKHNRYQHHFNIKDKKLYDNAYKSIENFVKQFIKQ